MNALKYMMDLIRVFIECDSKWKKEEKMLSTTIENHSFQTERHNDNVFNAIDIRFKYMSDRRKLREKNRSKAREEEKEKEWGRTNENENAK